MQSMPLLFYFEGNLLSRQASASQSACKTKLSPQHALALSILLLANLCPNPVKTHDVDPIFLYDHPTRMPTMSARHGAGQRAPSQVIKCMAL